ncbi:hypothetical protein [Nakamurella sp.]|uniref:hypothetical protein n=1 Tax=Nakamurella sp. TaxID=1869182 RepID=UPI0037834873
MVVGAILIALVIAAIVAAGAFKRQQEINQQRSQERPAVAEAETEIPSGQLIA